MKFKTIILSALAALAVTFSLIGPTTAGDKGDIIFMVPQKPGKGTSQWTEIVVGELRKTPALQGYNLVIKYYPGARDMAGPNLFHSRDRFRSTTHVLVSHGGNGISFVQEKVKYDYTKYDSICHQNLNIIVAKQLGLNEDDGIAFASGSGMVPEAMAIIMLIEGPGKTVDEYIAAFQKKVTWVNGLGSQRRLAFARGELSATRENPAAYKSKVEPLIAEGKAETWFHHGVLDIASGMHVDDVNHKGLRFEEVFKKKWGVYPSGDFYDAYVMIHTWRDAIQKALWVNKGNPNTELLRTACTQMANNPESAQIFEKKIGKYDWIIGEDGNKTVQILMNLTTEPALKALVKFNREALGLKSIYKPDLVK